jgi:hypothetical protein
VPATGHGIATPEDTVRMNLPADHRTSRPELRCGIVLRVGEDSCQMILGHDERMSARFAVAFPSPRTVPDGTIPA